MGRNGKRFSKITPTPDGVTYRRNPDLGMDGGYDVLLRGEKIGTVERRYASWSRKPRGRRYATTQGVCKRADWRARDLDGTDLNYSSYSRDEAADTIVRRWATRVVDGPVKAQ